MMGSWRALMTEEKKKAPGYAEDTTSILVDSWNKTVIAKIPFTYI